MTSVTGSDGKCKPWDPHTQGPTPCTAKYTDHWPPKLDSPGPTEVGMQFVADSNIPGVYEGTPFCAIKGDPCSRRDRNLVYNDQFECVPIEKPCSWLDRVFGVCG